MSWLRIGMSKMWSRVEYLGMSLWMASKVIFMHK